MSKLEKNRLEMSIREIIRVFQHLAECEDCVKKFNEIQKHDMEVYGR